MHRRALRLDDAAVGVQHAALVARDRAERLVTVLGGRGARERRDHVVRDGDRLAHGVLRVRRVVGGLLLGEQVSFTFGSLLALLHQLPRKVIVGLLIANKRRGRG